MEKWNKWHKKCISCETNTKPYYAKGKCLACYSKHRYATDKRYKQQHKVAVYKWRDEHRERWDAIQKKAGKKAWAKRKVQVIISLKDNNKRI